MPNEPLAQPTFKAIKPFRPLRRFERLHAARRNVVLHRVMAATQLPRNPLQTPPARPQAQHLRHVIRRLHHLPPWINPRRAFRDSVLVHSLSPRLSKEGAIPRDAEGAVFHGARQADAAGACKQRLATSAFALRAIPEQISQHVSKVPPRAEVPRG